MGFDIYILEDKELEFYMKKIQRKKGKGAAQKSSYLRFHLFYIKMESPLSFFGPVFTFS